jgi:prophage tail gpP-like protein
VTELAKEPLTGAIDDRVALELDGGETKHFENYSVRTSILQQPSHFSVTLSAAGGTAALLAQFPPRTKFTLKIGNVPQFTGETDGFEASGNAGSTSVTFTGRSPIARLFDADVDAEKSFTNVTYAELVQKAMDEVGLKNSLFTDNAATRKLKSGVTFEHYGREPKYKPGVVGYPTGVAHVVHAKMGETWFHFCERHLKKAGLFLGDDPLGNIVMLLPNKTQQPMFHFARKRGQARNVVNVEEAHFRNDATRRYSEVIVYGRSGGRKFGHYKTKGSFTDTEMEKAGFSRKRVFRDANVTNEAEAAEYARRKLAEMNRASWSLTYTISGHTAPTDAQGGRAVVSPDMVAHVEDDELGINADLYIESVEYHSPPRKTKVTLMRLEDLVFGDDADATKFVVPGTGTSIVPKVTPRVAVTTRHDTASEQRAAAARATEADILAQLTAQRLQDQ